MKRKFFLPTVLMSLCLSFSVFADGDSHEGGRSCQPGTPACPAGLVANPSPANDKDSSEAVTETLLEYLTKFFK